MAWLQQLTKIPPFLSVPILNVRTFYRHIYWVKTWKVIPQTKYASYIVFGNAQGEVCTRDTKYTINEQHRRNRFVLEIHVGCHINLPYYGLLRLNAAQTKHFSCQPWEEVGRCSLNPHPVQISIFGQFYRYIDQYHYYYYYYYYYN